MSRTAHRRTPCNASDPPLDVSTSDRQSRPEPETIIPKAEDLPEMRGYSPHPEILKAITDPEVTKVEWIVDGVKHEKEVVFNELKVPPSCQRMPKALVENRISFINLGGTEDEFDISIPAEEQRSWELVHHQGLAPSERYPKPRPCIWYGAEGIRPHEMLLRVPGDRWVLVFSWSGLNRELTKQEACYWLYRINGYELPIDLREFSTGPAVVDYPRLNPVWRPPGGADHSAAGLVAKEGESKPADQDAGLERHHAATDGRRDTATKPARGRGSSRAKADESATDPTAGKGLAGDGAKGTARREDADSQPERWLTVSAAATLTEAHKGEISRAVDGEQLKGNGKTGRDRRIDLVDLTRWKLERSKRPERGESNEHVKRLGRGAGFK
jgi:hypothetical protein